MHAGLSLQWAWGLKPVEFWKEHFGATVPVLLASITHLWGIQRGRPFTATDAWLEFGSVRWVRVSSEEMIEMQGVPIHPDALHSCAVRPLFDTDTVSTAALRRLAGNSFAQPCMTAFLSFCLAQIVPSLKATDDPMDGANQVFYGPADGSDGSSDGEHVE